MTHRKEDVCFGLTRNIDDKTFDKILNEFKSQNIIQTETKSANFEKTPLAEALDSKKKEETKVLAFTVCGAVTLPWGRRETLFLVRLELVI